MIIYAHFTEERSGIPKLLRKYGCNVQIVKEKMVCDYIIGEFGFERKAIEDYFNSLYDGSLNNQLFEQSDNFLQSGLIIEGNYHEYVIKQAKRLLGSQFRNTMLLEKKKAQLKGPYLSSMAGTLVKRAPSGANGFVSTYFTENKNDTARFLAYIYKKLDENETIRLPEIKKVKFSDKQWAKALLNILPGLNDKRSVLLLKHFKSARAFFKARPSEIKKIKGFKDGIVDPITKILDEEH
jgi:ERCC4-type nuclease